MWGTYSHGTKRPLETAVQGDIYPETWRPRVAIKVLLLTFLRNLTTAFLNTPGNAVSPVNHSISPNGVHRYWQERIARGCKLV
jgi:hypothetical protein